MRILSLARGALLCFFLSLALAASFSYAEDKEVEVVGVGECADCAQNNFDIKQAFEGLHVTIDCKAPEGHFKTRGKADLDEHGHFKVSLPKDIVKDGGELKEECYAQLHSASSAPCPAHESLESSKIVLSQGKTAEKNTFGLPGNLKFSPITCASKFFWHHFHNHPFFHHPSPPKEEPKAPTPIPPAPKKEKPCPPKKEKPAPKKEPCPPKKEKPAPKKEKPAPKKEPCPPKKEEPKTPVVEKPHPPETPTYKHPFFKHPFHNHPFFKHLPPFPTLPPHPFLPPHHP